MEVRVKVDTSQKNGIPFNTTTLMFEDIVERTITVAKRVRNTNQITDL